MTTSIQAILNAAKKGDLSFIKSQNIDETTFDDDGANCLHYATRGGQLELAKYLVEKKNFPVSQKTRFGSTVFHEAAASGSIEIVKWLWSKTEIDIDDGDNEGATPLHVGALYGQLRVVHWIVNNTSCELMSKTVNGALCLHFAVVGGNLKVTTLILTEIPRAVNLQLKNGATSAYLACQYGFLDILKFLVEKTANVKSIKSFDGMSCLHAACQGGHLDVVKYLVKEQGCNVNDRDLDGASCLHFAATNGRATVVAWMMKDGKAKVSLDNLGGSPLHNAAELGHFEVIKALLDNGCNADITDNDGLTAAELADKCNRHNCAALIRGELPTDNPEPVLSGEITNGNHQDPHQPAHLVHTNNQSYSVVLDKRRSPAPISLNLEKRTKSTRETSSYLSNLSQTNSQYSNTHHQGDSTDTVNSFNGSPESEYPIPEKDYPLNSDDGSEESFIINSPTQDSVSEFTPAPDYNGSKREIDPDSYEPPDLPPDTSSDEGSDDRKRARDQEGIIETFQTSKEKEKEEKVTSKPGSALSSATSSLSSPRHNGVNRSSTLSPSSSTGSVYSQGPPVIGKNMDLLAELKNNDPSSLRVTKKPHESKRGKMVFSFGDPSPPVVAASSQPVAKTTVSPKETKTVSVQESTETKSSSPSPTGDFDPKHFVDQVPDSDPSGTPYPAWRKQMLARQLADKAMKEAEVKKKEDDYEARFKNMPVWKRQMIERKEAQQKKQGK